MSSANYIYSLTSVVAFLRCEKIAPNLTETLLKNLNLTFGGETFNGEYLYKTFKSNSNLNNTLGFTRSEWAALESLIDGNLQSKIGIASLIYCFLVYSNIENKYKEYYVNKLYSYIYNNKPPKYFSFSEIQSLINSFSISAINAEIENSTDSKTESKIVNYNYYESLPLFATLDSDLDLAKVIKDSENQYYYISGEVFYDLNINSSECIKNTVTISTPTGSFLTTIYQNLPCFEKDSFVGPISGIKFYRIFNDGPPSSGYFDKDTMDSYIGFDENISNKLDYSSNKKNLYSFTKDLSGNYVPLKFNVQTDAQGSFSASGEYGYGHTNFISDEEGCEWEKEELEKLPLMRMHQGDNFPKYYYFKNKVGEDCITGKSGPHDWTGFKFANFELKDSWLTYFDFVNINPRLDKSRVLKRALNIENYFDQDTSIIHSPYLDVVDTGNGVLFCNNYIGYPQLDSNYSTLPGFAFYQTFDNLNFGTGQSGEYMSISIHPAFSNSNYSLANSKSNRSIEVSNFPIFTGKRNTHNTLTSIINLPINVTLNSSSVANYDEAFKKAMAIGDNFNNEISGSSSLQYNAGYIYTGYNVLKNGEKISLGSLLLSYQNKKLGATYSSIKYLSGYLETGTNKIYPIIPLTAHAPSGNTNESIKSPGEYVVYYYLNTETGNNSIMSVNTGWTGYFAPIPQGVISNPDKYSGLYNYQKVENYFPRYYSGPFASYENKFLYSNANYAYQAYDSFLNGFPYKISFVINVREENAREIYGTSGFYNGVSYENILRASGDEIVDLKVKMVNPFVPFTNNNSIKKKYDYYTNTNLYTHPKFIKTEISGFFHRSSFNSNLVDPFYVPSLDYCLQDNLNNELYDYNDGKNSSLVHGLNPLVFFNGNNHDGPKFITTNYNPNFINGIKITGQLTTKKIKFKNFGQTGEIVVPFIKKRSEALHWGYMGRQLSGEALYVPPIFDLSSFNLTTSGNMNSVFSKRINLINSNTTGAYSHNGFINLESLYDKNRNFNGRDPIFYEYIGGRIGDGAEIEGGYNSKGIIGDNWYDFDSGISSGPNYTNSNDSTIANKYLFLTAFDSGNLNIYAKGLYFYPFYSEWKYKPFTSSTISLNGISNISSFKINNSEYYYKFNLKDIFPLRSANFYDGEFYSSSGLTIGPFYQDVELCVLSGNSIIPSGNLYIDNKIIAGNGPFPNLYTDVTVNYDNDINRFIFTGGIIPGVGRRNARLTTFKLVPSGETVNINISGRVKIGFENEAFVTIRPRTSLFGVSLFSDGVSFPTHESYNKISGDYSFLESYNFINNGTEKKFSLPFNGSFTNLIGKKFEYITNSKIELLFPQPTGNFDEVLASKGLISYDAAGNKIYTSKKGPTYDYWKTLRPDLVIQLLRDTSRISFEIESIKIEYGDIPYQSHKIIIPSGNCTISGAFGYTGQAESAILSQGIYLTGLIRPSALEDYYIPQYVSDVLKRLPEEIEVLPSGSGKFVVLEAPSFMKRRKNYFTINGSETYENYSPIPGLNYNKFIWPALSDLATLNPDIVYETILPEDDNVFSNSNLFFSASQGQILSSGISGLSNPNENVTYQTKYLYAFVDSTATNSTYNTGKCIKKAQGAVNILDTGNLSGILTSEGITLGLKNKFNSL